MALVRPKWCGDAHPTRNGWASSNGELLKKQKISEADIAEWYGHAEWYGQRVWPGHSKPEPQTLHEAPVVEREVTQEEMEWHGASETAESEEEE